MRLTHVLKGIDMPRNLSLAALVCLALLLQGCAATALQQATITRGDPFEPWNRQVFALNEKLDEAVLQPVARGYKALVPSVVRTGVRNVVNNVNEMWSTTNLFLQGRLGDGARGVARVALNTTVGLVGLVDVASSLNLERSNEDLGQTLGVWGVGTGPYIVWPLLGPATLRDSADIPVSTLYFSPSAFATYPRETNIFTSVQLINLRADLLELGGLLDDVALDKYAFVRDAYLQRRRNLIYNGNPPDEADAGDSSNLTNARDLLPVAPPAYGTPTH